MEIRDKEGHEKIVFKNFGKPRGADPVFIDANVEIKTNGSIAKEMITLELSDLEELISNLKKLSSSLKYSFYFQHIDEQIQIRFEPQKTGDIMLSGFLKDKQYKNSLNFSFNTSLSEIDRLINEAENLIDVLR